jgi:putative glutamine amidotransferase
MSRPLIGITVDLSPSQRNGTGTLREATLFLPQRYCSAVEDAGGTPIILPMASSAAALRQYTEQVDGLLISGGNFDIHPSYYGEKPIEGLGAIKKERTEFELELTRSALKRDMPLLGICGGAQAINVVLGGSLYQDIATQVPHAAEHQQGERKQTGGHQIRIHSGTRLRHILRREALEVNTTHHQAVKKVGKGLLVNASADDDLIEGIESSCHSFVLGVQWHPEVLARRQLHQRRIFTAFVSFCKRFRRVASR